MLNDITIYDDNSIYNRIFTITDAYLNVWKSTNEIVNVFKNQWMIIFILFDVKSDSTKVYSLSFQNRKFVDEKFDRLHKQKKLNWTNEATSYAYFCFVVWKTINILGKSLERKNKVIIDIKNLNKISMFDAYLITQQSNVMSAVLDCSYISVMNCVSFFHQWLVRLTDRHKLTIINYREFEQWNVAIMSYRNSQAYVQRQIDRIFYKYKKFVKAYVDDVVVFFQSLKKHFRHFNQVFGFFVKMNIVFKSFKIYFGYSFVFLLDQKIDNFELFTIEKKLKIIFSISFSQSFKHLESYLKKTEYLKQYILYYAQKTDSFQRRKILLLKNAFIKKRIRKRHDLQIAINDFTKKKLNSFNQF